MTNVSDSNSLIYEIFNVLTKKATDSEWQRVVVLEVRLAATASHPNGKVAASCDKPAKFVTFCILFCFVGASSFTFWIEPVLLVLNCHMIVWCIGGLLIALPREQAAAFCKDIEKQEGYQSWIIGIVEKGNRTARIIDKPRVIEVPAKDREGELW